jgi:hypothetical protein
MTLRVERSEQKPKLQLLGHWTPSRHALRQSLEPRAAEFLFNKAQTNRVAATSRADGDDMEDQKPQQKQSTFVLSIRAVQAKRKPR